MPIILTLSRSSNCSARCLARLPSACAACALARASLVSFLSSASWHRRSVFSPSSAATLSASLWHLLSAVDFSRTASACCVRSLSTSADTTAVRAPVAARSVKSAAYKTHIRPQPSEAGKKPKCLLHLLQSVGHSTRLVTDGSECRYLAAGTKSTALRPGHHGSHRGRHGRRNNNKLAFVRPCDVSTD
jgi:hypothetical protein